MSSMSHSKGVVTSSQQLVYLSQWFTEMSEMQRTDFMKHLTNKYNCGQHSDQQFINGFKELGMNDNRPASIFQCRMKLFAEWFAQWSDEEKQELLIRLRNIDSQFMDEFQSNIETNGRESTNETTDDQQLTNGNIDDDSKSADKPLIEDRLEEEEEPIVASDPDLDQQNSAEAQEIQEIIAIDSKTDDEIVVNGNEEQVCI